MTENQSTTFGDILRHFRCGAGLTLEALAEQTYLSVRGLSDLEHNRVRAPRHDTLELLVAGLGLSPSQRALLIARARGQSNKIAAPGVLEPPQPVISRQSLAPLVGRDSELDRLDQHLAGQGPPLLLLAGEPGIGKTRLLQEAIQRGAVRGLTVLAGGCRRRGDQEPFSPLINALDHYIRGQEPFMLKTELAHCEWLVRLLPELAGGLLPPPTERTLSPAQERRLVFGAVRQFLANIAGGATGTAPRTLLVLDDLQWAGQDALDLLAALVHTDAESGLRVVAAYRDTEVHDQEPLALLRADLAVAGLAAQWALGPLAGPEAAHLLDALLAGTSLGGNQVTDALRHAEGTPFFLVSYAQSLRNGSTDTVPWDVTQSVRQRLALLPVAGREILSAAAVIGRQVPRSLLATVVGQTEEAMLPGLEAVCRSRLLIEDGEGAYEFAHDVIREVVETDTGAARRAALHRRIAQALENDAVRVSPERLAYHFARGGEAAQAVKYLELAGDQAWHQRASAAAERHYRDAIAQMAATQTRDASRIREKLAEVLYRSGRHLDAIEVLEPVAAMFQANHSWIDLARVVDLIGWAYARESRPRDGLVRVQPVIDVLEANNSLNDAGALAVLYEAKGQLLFADGRCDESLAAHDRSAMLTERSADSRLQVLAASQRTALLLLLGRLGEAARVGEAALPLAETVGDLEILWRIFDNLADIHLYQGVLPAAQRCVDGSCSLGERMGDPGLMAISLASRATIAIVAGNRQQARADLIQAQAQAELVCWPVGLAYVRIGQARLALDAEDLATAAAVAEEACCVAGTTSDLQAQRWAIQVSAEVDIRRGHPAAAVAHLCSFLDQPYRREYTVTALLPALAEAYLNQGEIGRAETALQQAMQRARPGQMRLVLVEALRVQALLAWRLGHQATARCHLDEGLAMARAIPYPSAETRLRYLWRSLAA